MRLAAVAWGSGLRVLRQDLKSQICRGSCLCAGAPCGAIITMMNSVRGMIISMNWNFLMFQIGTTMVLVGRNGAGKYDYDEPMAALDSEAEAEDYK